MVESYWIELKCYKNLDTSYEVRLQIKMSDRISKICRRLHEKFSVLETELTRLWTCTEDDDLELLDLNQTVDEAGLNFTNLIVLEVQTQGYWLPKAKILDHLLKMKRTNKSFNSSMTSSDLKKNDFNSKISYPDTSGSNEIEDISDKFKKVTLNIEYGASKKNGGLCGLVNLGNTCYMNSVLQCLSNCPPLTDYFLQNNHMYELNRNNPLGTYGELAKAYGELIQNMWSGESSCLRPFNLKSQVSRFNPQFRGWSQHDAQEFLSFLLDGLHEDLNRASKKSFKEGKDGMNQQSSNMSIDSWESHKTKNDSIVVDTFHGLLKSRVICPKCEKVSVTFDPFSTLSLPLPLHKSRSVKVNFIPSEPTKCISSFKIGVPQKGLFRDLISDISAKTNSDEKLLIPAEVTDYHIQKLYSLHEKIGTIHESEEIYVYELSVRPGHPDYSVVPVCFWNLKSGTDRICLRYGFGVPLLLNFKINDLREGNIGKCIVEHVKSRFNFEEVSSMDMYVVDLSHKEFADSVELQFTSDGYCVNNMVELLDLNNPTRIFERKMLFVNVPLTGKESFFRSLSSEAVGEVRRRGDKLHIYNCIDMFTSFEKLGQENAWYCPTCRTHQRATKKFDVWTTPRILILHLKRFSYSSLGDKLEVPIDFPVRGLCLTGYVTNPAEGKVSYDLVGVINHYGSLSGGHYTACCRNDKTGSWFQFNDNSVSPVDPQQVSSASAYVLFYSKVGNET